MAVKVPFAEKREQRLHKMFSCSRFTMTRRKKLAPAGWRSLTEAQCKIGIAKNLKRRQGTIQADKLSGKTEWFALSWMERLAVKFWLLHWAFWWLLFRAGVLSLFILVCYFLTLKL